MDITPRFIDNGDGTVTDNEMGIMWAKDAYAAGDLMDWEEALRYIDKLNANNGGYSDWRLPTIRELDSLVNVNQCRPALPADHLFVNVQSVRYWSSTASPDYVSPDKDLMWSLDMSIGSTGLNDKVHKLSVWPVRRTKAP